MIKAGTREGTMAVNTHGLQHPEQSAFPKPGSKSAQSPPFLSAKVRDTPPRSETGLRYSVPRTPAVQMYVHADAQGGDCRPGASGLVCSASDTEEGHAGPEEPPREMPHLTVYNVLPK